MCKKVKKKALGEIQGPSLLDVTCDTLVGKTLGDYPLTLRLDIFRWSIGEGTSIGTGVEGRLR